jgi:hypothetical protein
MHVIHALVVKMIAIDSDEIGAVSCHVVFLSSREFSPPHPPSPTHHSYKQPTFLSRCKNNLQWFYTFFYVLLILSLFLHVIYQ